MNLLSMENISKSYADKVLFKDISLGINEDDKLGLIGRNGEGKTTLLKILSGIENSDAGRIILNSETNIEYLPQNVDFNEDLTVLEQVFRSKSENIQIVRRYQEAINRKDIDSDLILKLTEEIEKRDLWELESEAKSILNRLGISEFDKKIGELSGGQKRRVALASALITPAKILILDEPTNHLDNYTIEWLEEYLSNRKGALVMVTHDRYFLDRVVNRVVELENRQLFEYHGNYQYYVEKKLEKDERDMASERKRKSLYRQELAWMQQGVKARGTRQKARVERFEELSESKLNLNDEDVNISVGGQRLGRKIVEIKNVAKSYGDKRIINDFSYTVLRDDRIGILGENGAGKSTLMNIIAGRLEADSGEVDMGETVKIGYFSQEAQNFDEKMRAIDYIKEGGEFIETADGSRITASQMMENFLFIGSEQWTPIEKLSGGERRRLYLLRVLMEGPNFLILDEPTNDLDINTLTVLEDYIDGFNGPVLIVSHDRYLLDKAVEKVFYIEDGEIMGYEGSYTEFHDYYRDLKKSREKLEEEPAEEVKPERKSNRTLKFSYNEKVDWENIEEEIQKIEERIASKEKSMVENSSNYVKLGEIMEEKEELEEKLAQKMERWMYLSELKEEIDNQ